MGLAEEQHIDIGVLFESARLKTELDAPSRSHKEACVLCRSRLNWMQTAADFGSREPEYEPPKAVMDKVLAFARGPSFLKRVRNFLVASMTYDSFGSPAPAGVRRSEAASRELTFEAGDLEIALSVRESPDRTLTLTGQVLEQSGKPLEDATARVDVVAEGDHVQSSNLSSWGEFMFSNLPQGRYDLHLFLSDQEIRIPSL